MDAACVAIVDLREDREVESDAPITTSRLILRPYRADDLDRLVAIPSQPEVARHLLDEPWTREFGLAQLERRRGRTGLAEPVGALNLAVEHDGLFVGTVALWRTEQDRRTVEVGWTLDPAHGGEGLATEAVEAGLRLAFERHAVHRVTAQMDARNTASARLARRVGMRQEAHFRQDFWSKGEWTDSLVFAMLADERTSS